MTPRAIFIGLLLGSAVSIAAFFNDTVIRQTFLVSHHLPVAVFGVIVVVALGVNPVLTRIGPQWRLGGAEVGVIAALGLAACVWPSFSFFRGFVANTALPMHWQKTEPAWQAQDVMAYVPRGVATIAGGQLRDAPGLARELIAQAQQQPESTAGVAWTRMNASERSSIESVAAAERATDADVQMLRKTLNSLIQGQPLAVEEETDDDSAWRNRDALVQAFPNNLSPPPRGESVLMTDTSDRVLSPLVAPSKRDTGLFESVPWLAWYPTLRVWGVVALGLAAASLCLALIVHPQWSARELLAYPIPRFVAGLAAGDESSAGPVIRQPAFWYTVGIIVLLHTVNGLHAWYPQFPAIPLRFDFRPLAQLFPDASRVYGSIGMFRPTMYLSLIAFSFFLSSSVSLSLGLSQVAYMVLGASLIGAGTMLDAEYIGAKAGNMLRFGGYVGMMLMILYIGRRYYRELAQRAVGWGSGGEVPRYSVWAARALVASVAVTVWGVWVAGLSVPLACAFVLLVLMMFVVMSRIVAETGLFVLQPWWMPVGVLSALLGLEAIGPTGYIVLALASTVLVGDPRTSLMPYLVNGLKMADQPTERRSASPGSLSWWLLLMVVIGFAASGVTALAVQYRFGVSAIDPWTQKDMPSLPFDTLATHLVELRSEGVLENAVWMSGWDRLGAAQPDTELATWIVVGFGLVVITAMLRLRLVWWPIHPVLFLIWGSYPAAQFAASFLIGWALKGAVTQSLGLAGYRTVLPVAIGVIAGELLAAFALSAIGVGYFLATRMSPPYYAVFP